MLFNSGSFLAAFAAFAVVYYAAAHRFRWMLLLAASLAFYAVLNVAYVPLLVAVTLVAYAGGLAIERASDERFRKGSLFAGVAVVVGVLGTVKYEYAPGAIAGVSFYTFSCVSYLADVYMRRIAAERHAGYFGVYVSFFPKLLAGPIERATPFLAQLREPAIFMEARVTAGLQQFLWGLFKKVVIADRLVALVDPAYSRPSFASPADLVLGTYFFAFQIYCDFSGYSDMACGAARVLGFELMENFRRPYLSGSTAEFWSSRWHVSLTSWFRDYVYIPLGGSRVSRLRWAINILMVFLLSALWHGVAWTFVVWGLLNGSYVLISNLRQRRPVPNRPPIGAVGSAIRAVLTFHLLLVTWVFFRAQSISDALTVLRRIASSLGRLAPLLQRRLVAPEVLAALVLIAVLMAVEWLDESRPMWVRLAARPTAVRWAAYYALAVALLVFGVWNVQQFVYMQF
jgi:alginate O-acetyltransferase complex protein AlgI